MDIRERIPLYAENEWLEEQGYMLTPEELAEEDDSYSVCSFCSGCGLDSADDWEGVPGGKCTNCNGKGFIESNAKM